MQNVNAFLGVDVGSVSTNLVLINDNDQVIAKHYLRTNGQPIKALCKGIEELLTISDLQKYKIGGVGTTGSGRQLADIIVGADIVKNEITTHAIAAKELVPEVNTIIEIGGQDSKLIILRDGIVYDFAMNTVCAAGTGSFLDRQAARLDIPIEDFGAYALQAEFPVRIAGRCAVFAESDMIHKQQTGHSVEDIVAGLCAALARNFLNNLAKGKAIKPPIVFQGGVAANVGMVAAFESALNERVIVPQYHDVMGAYGAALLAKDKMISENSKTRFQGFHIANNNYQTLSLECDGCANSCEIIKIIGNGQEIACWGDKCGKWSGISKNKNKSIIAD